VVSRGRLFWRVRQGHFTPNGFERALKKVSTITIAEDAELPRRVVSLEGRPARHRLRAARRRGSAPRIATRYSIVAWKH
jgi:hypothetical protein